MKKLMKGLGIGLVFAVIGLLVFGAVNRTMAKNSESATEEIADTVFVNPGTSAGIEQPVEVKDELANRRPGNSPVVLAEDGELNQDEIDVIFYMREEEKLARDVYLYMANLWGMPAFSNIASSEQVHMDSLLTLIDRYNLTDPALAEEGRFTNPDLQNLYDQLIAQGSQSAEEAFKVGAAIEEIDIVDLQNRLSLIDQVDIQQVFDSLLQGSYNHLNSFVFNLANRYGITYSPQYLTLDQYQAILTAAGTVNGQGSGLGAGQGARGGGQH